MSKSQISGKNLPEEERVVSIVVGGIIKKFNQITSDDDLIDLIDSFNRKEVEEIGNLALGRLNEESTFRNNPCSLCMLFKRECEVCPIEFFSQNYNLDAVDSMFAGAIRGCNIVSHPNWIASQPEGSEKLNEKRLAIKNAMDKANVIYQEYLKNNFEEWKAWAMLWLVKHSKDEDKIKTAEKHIKKHPNIRN